MRQSRGASLSLGRCASASLDRVDATAAAFGHRRTAFSHNAAAGP